MLCNSGKNDTFFPPPPGFFFLFKNHKMHQHMLSREDTYMQPKQCLLLNGGWITRESTTNEAKHLLHGERERAKFGVKHLAEN